MPIEYDNDSIFANHLDESIAKLGVKVLNSPPRCPKANAICERVIGTIRRECLDWLIPLSESHLRSATQPPSLPLDHALGQRHTHPVYRGHIYRITGNQGLRASARNRNALS